MRRSSAVDGPASARRCRWRSFDAWKARQLPPRQGCSKSTAFLITMRPWIGKIFVRWYHSTSNVRALGNSGTSWAAVGAAIAWAAAASQLAVGVRCARYLPHRSAPHPVDLQRSSRPGSHPAAGAPHSTVGPILSRAPRHRCTRSPGPDQRHTPTRGCRGPRRQS